MKKSKSKEAKFFCESCGSEVGRNARFCPTCGKFFASVRCPQCGRTGTNDDFKDGCPSCGYAINPDNPGAGGGSFANLKGNKNSQKNKRKYNRRQSIFSGGGRSSRSSSSGDSLPLWVYISSVFVLIILVICLYSCL